MPYDITDRVEEAWKYFDGVLDKNIKEISERAWVPVEQFVKINPMDFCEKNKFQIIRGYEYKKIKDFIVSSKTDDHTFLISPVDAIEETAAQISYKTEVKIDRTIRASKCEIVPCPKKLALDFFIRNHRQSAPLFRDSAVCFGFVFHGEIVAVMLYDISNGAVRGKNKNYELVRLSISKNTKVHGGASKLQAACETTLRLMGVNQIYSYSNATINSGAVYDRLGFTCAKIDRGQTFVVLRNNKITRLANLHPESTDEKLALHGWIKTHIGGNKTWVKKI